MKPKIAKWIEIDRQTGEQIGRPTFKWNPGKMYKWILATPNFTLISTKVTTE